MLSYVFRSLAYYAFSKVVEPVVPETYLNQVRKELYQAHQDLLAMHSESMSFRNANRSLHTVNRSLTKENESLKRALNTPQKPAGEKHEGC